MSDQYPTRFDRWWLDYARKHDLLSHAAGEKMMKIAEAAWKAGEGRKLKKLKRQRINHPPLLEVKT